VENRDKCPKNQKLSVFLNVDNHVEIVKNIPSFSTGLGITYASVWLKSNTAQTGKFYHIQYSLFPFEILLLYKKREMHSAAVEKKGQT